MGRALDRRPRRRRAPPRRCSTWRRRCRWRDTAGAGLLEIPAGANGRGLREAGVLPNAGPGLLEPRRRRVRMLARSPRPARGGSRRCTCSAILRELPDASGSSRLAAASSALPAATRSAARPARPRAVGAGAGARLDGRRARDVPDRGPARARRRGLPGRGLRREGGHVVHPDGRIQRLRPAVAPCWASSARRARGWQVLAELAARARARPRASLTGSMASQQLFDAVPFYAGLDARGDRRPRRALAGARRAGAYPLEAQRRMSRGAVLAIVGYYEEWWIQILKAIVIFAVGLQLVPVVLLAERKLLGRFQSRYGPNRVGPYGALQPLADILKLLTKEQFRPEHLDRVPVRAGADHLDPDRRRGVRDHPLRQRPAHLRHARRAVRDRRLDRPAVRVRVRRDRLLRDHARRLVLGLEVLVPRRDARRRAADLLRGLPGARAASA